MGLSLSIERELAIKVVENGTERPATPAEVMRAYPFGPQSIPYWESSITNNLTTMAAHVKTDLDDSVADQPTLYDLLWCRDGFAAGTITSRLSTAIIYMKDHRDDLIQYNPVGRWGDYNTLLNFTQGFMWACLTNPHGLIHASA